MPMFPTKVRPSSRISAGTLPFGSSLSWAARPEVDLPRFVLCARRDRTPDQVTFSRVETLGDAS